MYYKPFHHILLGEKGYLRYVGDLKKAKKTPQKNLLPRNQYGRDVLDNTPTVELYRNKKKKHQNYFVVILPLICQIFVYVSPLNRLYKGIAGYCSAYRGDVCRTILHDDLLVFFNSSFSNPEDTQEYFLQSWWAEVEGLSGVCSPALRSLLCHASFPDCNPSGLGPAPKPVCRQYCSPRSTFLFVFAQCRNKTEWVDISCAQHMVVQKARSAERKT